MLDEFRASQRTQVHRDDETNGHVVQSNQSSHSHTETEPIAHQDINSPRNVSIISISNNSTSSTSNGDQQLSHSRIDNNQHHNSNNNHHHHIDQHRHQEQQLDHNNCRSDEHSQYNNIESNYKFNSHNSLITNLKNNIHTSPMQNMNVDTTQQSSMVPDAHCSEHQIHYHPSPINKNLNDNNPSNMALNFSHNFLQQTNHHTQTSMHQDLIDVKPTLSNSSDLNSMQSAAVGMNMWKSPMNLNHFKHPAIADHTFLPSSEINSFSNWSHTNNLGPQSSSMTHHLLENQHLIGYQHQRSLPIPSQDLVGATIKGHPSAGQSPFMLNSINHHASTSQSSSSNHQITQPIDNLNLRPHPPHHNASYNLSMNDNQFYSSSRSENRSQQNTIKAPFIVTDRSVHVSLGNQSILQYQGNEDGGLQATTSHLIAGSSSGATKGTGNFRCQHCNEVFSLRTAYQSHIKTHSQDKGENFGNCSSLNDD